LLYDGSRQIKSDYNSYYVVLGAALTKFYPITDHLNADVLLGLDINTQHVESYKETDYFAWDSRSLTQLQSRVQAGLDYRFNENKASVFARVGAENRNLIGGATQDYEINNTNVSFNTNNKNDTYLTAQVGFRAQLEKRISVFGVMSTLHSADSVNTVQGNIGLRADF
jgi:outer membrane autotransporter protein